MLCFLEVVAFLFSAQALAFSVQELEAEDDSRFPNAAVRVEIQLSDAAGLQIEKAPRLYVRADARIGAENYSACGIHLKGYGSFQALSQKPSLTVKFDKFVPKQNWLGLRKIHLNNAGQDPSYLSEYLGSEMFHAAGLPAPRTAFATLRLTSGASERVLTTESTTQTGPPHEPGGQTNRLTPHPGPLPVEGRGRPDAAPRWFDARPSSENSLPTEGRGRELGLYILVEGVTKDFLTLNFHTGKGTVYEGSFRDIDRPLEVDVGESDSTQSDLRSLEGAAKEPDLEKRLDRLKEVLDFDQFISFMAMEKLLGHWDGYCNSRTNYRIYHHPGTGRLIFIPHGMDSLFHGFYPELFPQMKGLVAQAILEIPTGKRLYADRIKTLLATVVTDQAIQTKLDQAVKRIRPVLAERGEAEARRFDAAVDQFRQRIALHLLRLRRQLDALPKP